MNTFKFRAEIFHHVLYFFDSYYGEVNNINIINNNSEWVVTFDSSNKLQNIKKQISNLTDLHVIFDTIAFIENYTGERS